MLAPSAAEHLEVPREQLLEGQSMADVLTAWEQFFRPEDRLAGWGGFSWELLAQEGWKPLQPPIDLRLLAAHRLKRRPGTAEAAAAAIRGDPDAHPMKAPGRAGRTVRALAALVDALRREWVAGRSIA
jgi:hypothetical protein